MLKAMWIAILAYFGLIAIASPVVGNWQSDVNLHDVNVILNEELEWAEFHAIAMAEYEDEFTALFNAVEVKRSKDNRIMVKSANGGGFKFAKKG